MIKKLLLVFFPICLLFFLSTPHKALAVDCSISLKVAAGQSPNLPAGTTKATFIVSKGSLVPKTYYLLVYNRGTGKQLIDLDFSSKSTIDQPVTFGGSGLEEPTLSLSLLDTKTLSPKPINVHCSQDFLVIKPDSGQMCNLQIKSSSGSWKTGDKVYIRSDASSFTTPSDVNQFRVALYQYDPNNPGAQPQLRSNLDTAPVQDVTKTQLSYPFPFTKQFPGTINTQEAPAVIYSFSPLSTSFNPGDYLIKLLWKKSDFGLDHWVDVCSRDTPRISDEGSNVDPNVAGCQYCPAGTYQGLNGQAPICKDGAGNVVNPLPANCSTGETCNPVLGCTTGIYTPPLAVVTRTPPCSVASVNGTCPKIKSGLGDLPTNVAGFTQTILGVVLSLIGGLALLIIIISGYRIMTSQGNPEQLQAAKEQLTAAIVGLLFVVFSLVILQVIGFDILRLPGFGK